MTELCFTGGQDSIDVTATAEVYDPAPGLFSGVKSMATTREEHPAALLQNDKVLITGGLSRRLASSVDLSSAELHDPSTKAFAPIVSMGTSDLRAELFDPNRGGFAQSVSLSVARRNHTATLLPGGRTVLVTGGNLPFGLSSAEVVQ